MPAPKKRRKRSKRFRPKLSTFVKNINFSPFRKLLPRGESDPKELYYAPESLLKGLILRQLLDLTYRELEELLHRVPSYARACGFINGYIPHFTYFNSFYGQLSPSVLEDIGIKILHRLARRLSIPCKVIAVDSAPYKAWANSFTKSADPDAGTGKSATKGWFFGYKVHVVVDTQTELIVAIQVTPGNCYDGKQMLPCLKKAKQHLPRRFQAILGDKGYDAGYNYRDICDLFQAAPIIPIRGQTTSINFQQTTLDQFFPLSAPVRRNETLKEKELRTKALRHNPPIPRDTTTWKELANKRTAVERVLGRFERFFCPPQLRTRRLKKVTIWALLGWIGHLSSAFFLSQRNHRELVRSFPYRL